VLSYPFANNGDLAHVVAEQQYIVQTESYTPPTLNSTITVGATTLYLVGDYNHSPIDSGCIEFTRRWSSIPALRNEFEMLSCQFPGYKFNTGNGFADRGSPRSLSVPCLVVYEYFLCATGQTYTDPGLIPVIIRQRYILTFGAEGNSDVDFVLFSGFAGFFTTPSAPAYQALVTAGTLIVAEDSHIERYAGNIWVRITKYVAAQ
jgi:hypothetical protein